MSAPIGPCSVCATPTPGEHIAGSLYLYCCDRCDEQTNADFDAFIGRVIAGDIPDAEDES